MTRTTSTNEHTVQFYDDEAFLVRSLTRFAHAGFEAGTAVIVIATPARRAALDQGLIAASVEVEALKATGRYLTHDSAQTLAQFLVEGAVNRERFEEVVGDLVERTTRRWGQIHIFGDMVSLLWDRGDRAGAIYLETLWNILGQRHSFSLLCAYPMAAFGDVAREAEFRRICDEHTRVIPAESFTRGTEFDDASQRKIALLQQKAAALEAELTERKRLEQELRRSQEELVSIVESANFGMHWVNADGVILWANQAELQMLGYAREEYVGRSIVEFHEHRTVINEILQRLLRGERLTSVEACLRCKDGSIKTVLIDSTAYWKEGQFVHTQCFTRDITQIQRDEANSRHLVAIIESSDDAIVSKDLNGIITSWNRGAQRLFGYSDVEAIGQSVTMLIPEDRLSEEQEILGRIRRGQLVDHFETVRRQKDGRLIDVSLTISPIRGKQGQITGASKIARDITERKRAEREVELARDQAIAASRAKDDFLATLSHELRTPLNPVLLLATEAASNPELPAAVRADFDLIAKNVGLEAKLIDDLLDLTRITRGKIVLDTETTDLRGVMRDALATVAADFQQKKIGLSTDLGDSRCPVEGDPVRLLQVFWNVLKNAAKFSPMAGRVTVQLGRSSDGRFAVASVSDTGIGLTAPELARLFNAFAQGEHAQATGAHRYGGLGLGLAISRTLVELHGGRIHAASEGRDRGATFTIELPLALPGVQKSMPSPKEPAPRSMLAASGSAESASGQRILLVEDHESTRGALVQLLTRRSFDVVTAASVAEARIHAASVDFVISDIGLPDGSGFDLMRELRDQHGLTGLALTGYGMEEDIVVSRRSGFLGHLTKPINVRALDEALATHLTSQSRGG